MTVPYIWAGCEISWGLFERKGWFDPQPSCSLLAMVRSTCGIRGSFEQPSYHPNRKRCWCRVPSLVSSTGRMLLACTSLRDAQQSQAFHSRTRVLCEVLLGNRTEEAHMEVHKKKNCRAGNCIKKHQKKKKIILESILTLPVRLLWNFLHFPRVIQRPLEALGTRLVCAHSLKLSLQTSDPDITTESSISVPSEPSVTGLCYRQHCMQVTDLPFVI